MQPRRDTKTRRKTQTSFSCFRAFVVNVISGLCRARPSGRVVSENHMKRFAFSSSLIALVMTAFVAAAPSRSPVADAARRGDRDTVRTLLKQGADVGGAHGDGMTALHWAAERGDAAMTEMLVYAGAHVAAVTRIGQYTALHLGSQAGSAPVVQALLKAGANVAARTTNTAVTAL